MKDAKSIIADLINDKKSDWVSSLSRIRSCEINTDDCWGKFFASAKNLILTGADFYSMIEQDQTLTSFSLEQLQKLNNKYHSELLPGANGYEQCFANPDYAISTCGLKDGQVLSALYTHFRQYISLVRVGNYYEMNAQNNLFLVLFEMWQNKTATCHNILTAFRNSLEETMEFGRLFAMWRGYSTNFKVFKNIIETSDFADVRYLYRTGLYVRPETLEMAKFMASYPENELKEIAAQHVKAYLISFERKKMDYRSKKTATVVYPMGMEKLAFYSCQTLEEAGLSPLLGEPRTRAANEQYIYDTRFNNALYLDQSFAEKTIEHGIGAQNAVSDLLSQHSGSVVVWLFGEEPFEPEQKKSALTHSADQDLLQKKIQSKLTTNLYRISPREQTSFSIISFPSTEIGKDFKEIFKSTLELNSMDGERFAEIQQYMIDILDKAQYVHVKGVKGNDTDIKVQLQKINDPEKETLFENCIADVNIPVGEVFTSPKLKGTDGVLHVADIYLWNLRYYNLRIEFKDGMITDYSCSNFADKEESRKYVFDNLLKPHETLPIGEFAIGTNTKAYRMARKYDIGHLLPILITEKMGPHFAIGDTCYAHEEDSPHYALITNKLIIATGNEKSDLRKTDPSQAYTYTHTDITLPYDMLAEISAVMPDGSKTPIIKDGLFAVPGTEELNEPLLSE